MERAFLLKGGDVGLGFIVSQDFRESAYVGKMVASDSVNPFGNSVGLQISCPEEFIHIYLGCLVSLYLNVEIIPDLFVLLILFGNASFFQSNAVVMA